MKPTARQKKVFELIINQIKFWQQSYDIHSPTNLSDIEETVNNSEELEDNEKEILIKSIVDLYYTMIGL